MFTTKKTLAAIGLLAFLNHASAEEDKTTLKCKGMYVDGSTINVMLDIKSLKLIVDGVAHDIVDSRKIKGDDNYVFFSENFLNTNGTYIYDSFKMKPPNGAIIGVVNAVTNKLLGYTELGCYKE